MLILKIILYTIHNNVFELVSFFIDLAFVNTLYLGIYYIYVYIIIL